MCDQSKRSETIHFVKKIGVVRLVPLTAFTVSQSRLFGTTVNAHEIFATTVDIQAIASRHVETVVLLQKMKA